MNSKGSFGLFGGSSSPKLAVRVVCLLLLFLCPARREEGGGKGGTQT